MGKISPILKGKADMSLVSQLIKSRLNPIPEFNLKFHKTETQKLPE